MYENGSNYCAWCIVIVNTFVTTVTTLTRSNSERPINTPKTAWWKLTSYMLSHYNKNPWRSSSNIRMRRTTAPAISTNRVMWRRNVDQCGLMKRPVGQWVRSTESR